MRYYIYCDESTQKGSLFSNFFGGVLINSKHFELIQNVLDAKRIEVINTSEMKWQKVNQHNYKAYMDAMDSFFDFVQADKIKVRIMFTQNRFKPKELTEIQKKNSYVLLYYQFIKNAFGLKYLEGENQLHIFLDNMPHNETTKKVFKKYLWSIQFLPTFSNANISIREDEISEVESHHHILMQYLDVVLGSMSYKLNKLNLVKDEKTGKRGKRTLAKDKLYKHILKRIRTIYPNFNIGISTGIGDQYSNSWQYPYKHWLFKPSNFEIEE